MSGSEGDQAQNDENMTSNPDVDKRREYVYQNMCKPPSEEEKVADIAKKFKVDERTIYRDKEWCRQYRPATWASELAQHGFLFNTMEYETRMKNDLRWLYTQRDSDGLEPMERLAYQKEISATLNNIVAVGSKHPFYEGIKKLTEEKEDKEQ